MYNVFNVRTHVLVCVQNTLCVAMSFRANGSVPSAYTPTKDEETKYMLSAKSRMLIKYSQGLPPPPPPPPPVVRGRAIDRSIDRTTTTAISITIN